ncbi:hypothetical protein M0812_24270 [Anaeramoeba flamelloides]|uniref:Uncharacterized protein n=1 Tax=Anaeramoeba flamelloides TaxID=1746091 RepID=A0AAV7YJX0_9EUKA|nr:hypothetical protein M0812_24270 [Anaeramoeba flamelloides]
MRYFYLLLVPIFFLTYTDTYDHPQFLSSYFLPISILIYLQQLEEDKIVKRILYITLCGLTSVSGYFFSLDKQTSSYQAIVFNTVYYLLPALLQNKIFRNEKFRFHLGTQFIYPSLSVVLRFVVLLVLPKLKHVIASGYLQARIPLLIQFSSVCSMSVMYFFIPCVSCLLYWVFGQFFYLTKKKKETFRIWNSNKELFGRLLIVCFVLTFLINLSLPRIHFIRHEHKTSPLLNITSLSVSQLSEQYETLDETEEYLRTKYASELRESASIKEQFKEKVLKPYNEKLLNLTSHLSRENNSQLIMWSESNGLVISRANEKKLIKELKKVSANSCIHTVASYSVFKRDPSGNRKRVYNNRIVVIDSKGKIILHNEKKNPVNELEQQSQWISRADNQYLFNLEINNTMVLIAVMYFDDLLDHNYKSDLLFPSKFAHNGNEENGTKVFPDLLLLPMSKFVPKSHLDKLLRSMAVQNGISIVVQPRNENSFIYSPEGIVLKSLKLPSQSYDSFFLSHSSIKAKAVPSVLMKIQLIENLITLVSFVYLILVCILSFIDSKKKINKAKKEK